MVGAGFAGAAVAFHLTRMGMERVTILEQEEVPGMHASGRNAAMVRQVVPHESIAALARGGSGLPSPLALGLAAGNPLRTEWLIFARVSQGLSQAEAGRRPHS